MWYAFCAARRIALNAVRSARCSKILPRAGSGADVSFWAVGGGLSAFPVGDLELPVLGELPVPVGSGLDVGGLVATVEGGKKAPGRGGDSGGVAAEPVEPEPVLEKLQVRMRCCWCCWTLG